MSLISKISEKRLNNFIVQSGQSNFLQAWEWGEFQKGLGRQIWRIGTERKGALIASALIIKKTLPLGRCYLYCPRGPVFSNFESSLFKDFLAKIREIGRKEKTVFFRFDFPESKLPIKSSSHLVQAPFDVQPKHTLILDLRKDETNLLQEMKSKTRYNIRLAKRKGVQIRQSLSSEDLQKFLSLIKTTAQRDGFKSHPESYYREMVEFFGKKGLLQIFLADYEGETIAVNLVLFFGRQATYLHGASSNEHRNVMAPHLLQWEQIKEARKRGCLHYDFWGISSERQGVNSKTKSWSGITRFKKGFGGKEVGYAGTRDLVLKPSWYRIYKVFRRKK